jgi:L-alanine-DL-glutamate epimerase-like enolase superfamily enzyme
MVELNICHQKNSSIESALDMAFYELRGNISGLPVYALLEGE